MRWRPIWASAGPRPAYPRPSAPSPASSSASSMPTRSWLRPGLRVARQLVPHASLAVVRPSRGTGEAGHPRRRALRHRAGGLGRSGLRRSRPAGVATDAPGRLLGPARRLQPHRRPAADRSAVNSGWRRWWRTHFRGWAGGRPCCAAWPTSSRTWSAGPREGEPARRRDRRSTSSSPATSGWTRTTIKSVVNETPALHDRCGPTDGQRRRRVQLRPPSPGWRRPPE